MDTARSAAGYTLIEVMVAIGITSLVVGIFGTSVYQVVSLQTYWRDDVGANRELRRAGTWFSNDSLNAVTTSLTDGAASVNTLTMNWVSGGSNVSATYSVSNDELIRNFEGQQLPVARDVSSATFSISNKLLTFTLTVNSGDIATESRTLQTYLRKMQ